MTELKATPGPWMVDAGETYNVRDCATEGIICQIHFLRGRMGLAGRITPQQGLANAHLLAASWEMYQALEDGLSMVETLEEAQKVGSDLWAWCFQVCDSLAKARGEQ